MLFAAESGIPVEFQVVDLFTGEHFKPPYEAVNPTTWCPCWKTATSGSRRARPF
jgi:glutathione S-transferase